MNASSRFRLTAFVAVFVFLAAGLLLARSSGAPAAPVSIGPALKSFSPPLTINNPAAVYCTKLLGYEYQIVDDGQGGQSGMCVLPDATTCGAWDFLAGTCGVEFSYCATIGLETLVLPEGGQYTDAHAVCVNADGEQVGSVESLSDLGTLSLGCGGEGVTGVSGEKSQDSVADPSVQALVDATPPDSLPGSFDWRNATFYSVTGDWTTPVKDQGGCGSCWAFSAAGTAESALNLGAINPNLDQDLSEEYLVSDCYKAGGYQNCCGGWKDLALGFIRTTGIPDEGCMPYVDGSSCTCGWGTCDSNCNYRGSGQCSDVTCGNRCGDWSNRMRRIAASGSAGTNRDTIKTALINLGPLAVSLDMSQASKGGDGIYRCSYVYGTDHAVVVVGYNDNGGNGYWIVKNSWGSGWNGNGYFNLGYGQCNIETKVIYAKAGPYTISGYVRNGGVGVSGVSMSGLPGNQVTNASGFYSVAVPTGWNGTATPVLSAWVFTPSSKSFSGVYSDKPSQNFAATPCYSLTTSVSGSGSLSVNPAPNCEGALYKSGTAVTLTASPDPSNFFSAWSGSLTTKVNPAVVSITSNKSITANFLPCYTVAITISPGAAGTVSVLPVPNCGAQYRSGTVLTLKAMPTAGFAFNQWSGDISGATSPRLVTVDAAKNITAEFLPCYALTKIVSPPGSGMIAVSPPSNCVGGLYRSGTNLTFTAVHTASTHFLEWTGAFSSSTNPAPFVISAPASVTGNFVIVPAVPSLRAPAVNALVTNYTPVFDWGDSAPNLDHYQIQVASDLAFASLVDDQIVVPSTYTPLVSLPSNSTLYWRVRAFDSHGFTRGWTVGRVLRTALLPPTLVSPAEAEQALTPRPAFTWVAVTGASGYTIQIAKNDTFIPMLNTATLGAVTTYTPPVNLPPDMTLYWRVRANGLRGPSLWSDVRTFFSANPPSTPNLIAPAMNVLITNYYPTFDWSASTVPNGTTFNAYLLQIDENADFSTPYLEVGLGGLASHTYTVVDPWALQPNTKYYWRVQACNTDNECSAWSLVRTLRTAILPPVLSTPADTLTVPTIRPTFDWGDVSGANGYALQVSKNNTFSMIVLNATIIGGTKSQFTPLVNLPVSTTLYWRVKANGPNGPSLWSSPVWSFTTPNPPGVPVLTAPALNALLTDYSPTFKWSKPVIPAGTFFDHYQIQISSNAEFGFIVKDADVSTYDTPEYPYTPLPTLDSNMKYYWRVRAWDTLGHYSLWSNVRYFRTALSAPTLVYPGDITIINILRPPFDWADVPGAASYTIQVSRYAAFSPTLINATTVGAVSIYTPLINLPINVTLYWRVRANGLNGPSQWSALPAWTFTVVP